MPTPQPPFQRSSLLPAAVLALALSACGGGTTSGSDVGASADGDAGATSGGDTGGTSSGTDAATAAGADAATPAGADAATPAGADAANPADPVIAAWLKEHNDVRASAQPTPTPPLPALVWNEAAAAIASAWVAKCNWGHNAGRGNYGENIAGATNELTPASVVAMWASEAADYDYATNGCTGVCGHYTQIVWRSTTSVGCAIQRCTTGSPFGGSTWYFAACDYSPPGNFVGSKPY